MLSENHSLLNEFPHYKDKINTLLKHDAEFAQQVKDYDALDTEIRTLELADAPIDDITMNDLKKKRSILKDAFNKQLLSASK